MTSANLLPPKAKPANVRTAPAHKALTLGAMCLAAPPGRAGLASGIANLARMLGATLGVAVLGTVLGSVGAHASHGAEFRSGLQAALLVGAAVEFLGAAVAARVPSRRRGC